MIGDRLRFLRNEKKMSQASLAEYLNMTPTAVWKYEKELCDPDVNTLVKLADLFDVPLDYLVGRTNIRDYGENTPSETKSDIKKGEEAINSKESAVPYTLEDIHTIIDYILIKRGIIKMEGDK